VVAHHVGDVQHKVVLSLTLVLFFIHVFDNLCNTIIININETIPLHDGLDDNMSLKENNPTVKVKEIPIIETSFLEEKAIHPKIQIRVRSLDDLKRIAKFYNEIILKLQPDGRSTTSYYVIFKDRYFSYRES